MNKDDENLITETQTCSNISDIMNKDDENLITEPTYCNTTDVMK
jgi:hypothetical protein